MSDDLMETGELIFRAKKGEEGAQNRLLERLSHTVSALISRKLGPEARRLAETGDILSEALAEFVRNLSTFEGTTLNDMLRYLRRIAENKIRDKLKTGKAQKRDFRREVPLAREGDTSEPGAVLQSKEPSPSEHLLEKELEERFRRAEAQLSEQERELIQLRRDWGASFAEISDLLGMKSPDAARMALARSLSKLSSLLLM